VENGYGFFIRLNLQKLESLYCNKKRTLILNKPYAASLPIKEKLQSISSLKEVERFINSLSGGDKTFLLDEFKEWRDNYLKNDKKKQIAIENAPHRYQIRIPAHDYKLYMYGPRARNIDNLLFPLTYGLLEIIADEAGMSISRIN
jgi:hypothetical protein